MSSTTAHAHDTHDHGPALSFWVKLAIVLAIITAIEVAIYYIPAVEGILVPLLIVLSAIKFIAVIWYFMHLSFDQMVLRGIFISALVVSIAVFIGLWVIMYYDNPTVFHPNMSIFDQKPSGPN